MTRDSSRTGGHGHRTLRAGVRCLIITEMRFRAPWALVTALLALTLPAVAAAEPKPIKKPEHIAPIKPAQTQTSTPPASPPSPPPSPPASSSSSSTSSSSTAKTPPASTSSSSTTSQGSTTAGTTGTVTSGTNTPLTSTVVVVAAAGGRDQSGIAVPAPPPPQPTPLGTVGAAQHVTSPGSSTPAWKIGLLALLAATEAFLVVRLVRDRPGDHTGDLSPAS